MQEYFVDQPLEPGKTIVLPKDKAFHAFRVLKLNHETIRLVSNGIGYFADAYAENGVGYAAVLSRDPDVNELPVPVTLCMAMIRREKFELVLQKATELGVARIVPFLSSRCVVKAKEEKEKRQSERWNAIVTEASEQCKRNVIPQVTKPVRFRELPEYRSDLNLAAYEGVRTTACAVKHVMRPCSVTGVIGPEGGFSEEEVSFLESYGFVPVSLGSRILRAETAAIYLCSAISEALF
jgi:16S rRNA (uracil1498-N3)-methyltransferase